MLKQLKLYAQLKQRTIELEKFKIKEVEFKKRSDDLKKALEEAITDEDMKLLERQIDDLKEDTDNENIKDKIIKLQEEIAKLQDELKILEEKEKSLNSDKDIKQSERGLKMRNINIRELINTGDYYERSEVLSFYDKFKNIRSVGGEGLTIPQIVIDRIMDIVGDYSTLYPLVDKIKAKGTARILIDTDTSPAFWIEQTAKIPDGDIGTITNVDFDGFKIGKIIFVDNSMLSDSIINLDSYVTKKLARAIALGIDKAILKGTGATDKQPEGIIKNLDTSNIATVKGDNVFDIVKNVSLIDTGEQDISEIVAVMNRRTYYNRLLQYSINVDSSGNTVGKLPNIKEPDLLGIKIIFNNHMDNDQIIFGDFSKYTLVEREDISIDKSEHVKFSEDQVAFRGKGRFDGKPTNKNAFVLIKIDTITKTTK